MRWFFSYARADARTTLDGHRDRSELETFYNDLEREVNDLLPEADCFRDDHTLELGDAWEARLLDALGRAKVMTFLYSPRYFASPYCGKEWGLFRSRCVDDESLLIPILWLPATSPPREITKYQYSVFGFPDAYTTDGLLFIQRTDKQAYLLSLRKLAKIIVKALQEPANLRPLEPGVTFKAALNPFESEEARLAREARERLERERLERERLERERLEREKQEREKQEEERRERDRRQGDRRDSLENGVSSRPDLKPLMLGIGGFVLLIVVVGLMSPPHTTVTPELPDAGTFVREDAYTPPRPALQSNPWIRPQASSLEWLEHEVTCDEVATVLHRGCDSSAADGHMTSDQARAVCAALDARLPRWEEYRALLSGIRETLSAVSGSSPVDCETPALPLSEAERQHCGIDSGAAEPSRLGLHGIFSGPSEWVSSTSDIQVAWVGCDVGECARRNAWANDFEGAMSHARDDIGAAVRCVRE